jgi:hypothetical protein
VVLQMIPSQLKFSVEGATPSFADNEGQTVEAGSQVRLRIKGIRSELNQMYAIGSIREDYLGYEVANLEQNFARNTDSQPVLSCSSNFRATIPDLLSLTPESGRAVRFSCMFLAAVYHNLDFSEALEKRGQVEKNKGEGQVCLCFMPNRDTPSQLKAWFRNAPSHVLCSRRCSLQAALYCDFLSGTSHAGVGIQPQYVYQTSNLHAICGNKCARAVLDMLRAKGPSAPGICHYYDVYDLANKSRAKSSPILSGYRVFPSPDLASHSRISSEEHKIWKASAIAEMPCIV